MGRPVRVRRENDVEHHARVDLAEGFLQQSAKLVEFRQRVSAEVLVHDGVHKDEEVTPHSDHPREGLPHGQAGEHCRHPPPHFVLDLGRRSVVQDFRSQGCGLQQEIDDERAGLADLHHAVHQPGAGIDGEGG
ncbi:MAG TPA: hypothetical protein VE988_03550 [Gemmataceae bacterium]|nr:hypothetical protein [Gemmataceae bacterium]